MPRLNATKAAEVRKAGEEGAFPLFPIGLTVLKLVDVTTGNARSGAPMWTWEFRYVEYLEDWQAEPDVDPESVHAKHPNERFVDKPFKYWTTIQDSTLWDLDRVFAAFDAEPNTDTDDLLGAEIVVAFDHAIANGGRNKGEMQAEIVKFYTLKDGRKAAEEIKATSGRSPAKKAAAKATASTPAF